jgi:hypothetical protein
MRRRGPGFQPGDLVTRDGTDVHRVISTNGDDRHAPDMIEVECIKEPLGFLQEDGVTRDPPWAKIGQREHNLARRYSYAGEAVDADAIVVRALPASEPRE